ncbi:hypothetical protein C8Q76DRAFT_630304, partial [Earliella scabrosa]
IHERVDELERSVQLHLHLDSVGAADYASASAGAFVVDALTSPTYTRHLKKTSPHYYDGLWLKSPVLALLPELQPGYCWAMAGSSGTLGVTLAQMIEPRAFTIDHIAKPLSLQYTSAPKNGQVWGILQDPHDFNGPLITSPASDVIAGLARANPYYRRTFTHLANFTYDVHALRPVQTFQVFDTVSAQKVRVQTVVFKFTNNWGHEAYTCVYRVRAHGVVVGGESS